jgi:hypothetical protein
MISDRLVNLSERWFRLLERFYPPDFRDTMGDAVVETYRDRARDALRHGGILRLAAVWMSALVDSLRNGPGERVRSPGGATATGVTTWRSRLVDCCAPARSPRPRSAH